VCTEASNVLRVLAVDFFFNYGIWKTFQITIFGTYQGKSTIMHKAFDWKRRISVLKVEAILQSCIP
jgi:hypothetical protein